MSVDVETVKSQFEQVEERLDRWDGLLRIADPTVPYTQALAMAERAIDKA